MMDFDEQEKVLKGFFITMLGLALAIGVTIGAIAALLVEKETTAPPGQVVNQEGKTDRLIVLPGMLRE